MSGYPDYSTSLFAKVPVLGIAWRPPFVKVNKKAPTRMRGDPDHATFAQLPSLA
jgi:hypothetical protein